MRRSTGPPAPEFGVEVVRGPAHTTVRLTGEIDLGTAARVADVLDRLLDQDFRTVEVDLRDVGFLAAAGLTVLVEADRRYRDRSGRLLLLHPSPACVRLFTITELDRTLTIR